MTRLARGFKEKEQSSFQFTLKKMTNRIIDLYSIYSIDFENHK